MNNEEPSTDYGLSSEIDIIFSEMKENKKSKNVGETSQAASLQFASQPKDDKINEKDTYKENKRVCTDVENADDKLITWAARLELESISLKEIVTGNLGHIFKQNYDFLKVACEEITTKLSQMASQMEEMKKVSSGCDIDERLIETVNALSEKVTTIEKPCSSRDRRNSIESIQTIISEKVDYSLTNNKSIKAIIKSVEKMSHNLEKKDRPLQDNTCDSNKPSSENETKMCNILEAHDKATLDKLTSLQKSISDNVQGTNPPLTQEIASIKQYLKLLLPRIVGLETNSKRLYHDYHELHNLLSTHIHSNPMQADSIVSSDNSPDGSTVPSTSKRILNQVSVPDNLDQKKRRLI
ncbi:DEHA2G06908p [Debaryomyces hansenii CBS767]|uniref:DEHA2G06908p n=1 Tax=Debaryomyces hansenii (strain ATCC 36239 / CBS 767 / BCRC 21394 / JCM 1990 / NBRC 0083 / IGC 2968) TaxID=284592 RepID=Q6BIX3_DEBHA|nr:DEHA2G06908p [Debaryomyces hansenii CBS767]CAG90309.2 DEHA2G06908p [Debaryomyces hansenii CBS767]|eukprot:XP_461848.2 DEHA2G06908p [Debaryomyces hansenii CBS767]